MTTLNGIFEVTSWDETVLTEYDDGAKLSQAKVTQKYQGDIEGKSEVHYFLSYSSSGRAEFVGYETINCHQSNIEFDLIVLRHTGEFYRGIASSQFEVNAAIQSANTKCLNGVGRFKSGDAGYTQYCIEIE